MEEIIKKLEEMGTRILNAVEERPFKSIITTLIAAWLIGIVIKSLRGK